MQDQAEQSTGYTPSIEIPRGVIDFLKPRGNYMPQQRGRAGNALRFNDIAGEDAEDVPPELYEPNPKGILREEHLVKNRTKRGRQVAEKSTVKALQYVLGKGSYEDISRHYMINTGTVPIKVKWRINGKRAAQEVYVKRPDNNRIVGKYLYGLISGMPTPKWAFNEDIFVEEAVDGNPLSRYDESILLQDDHYWQSLARAAVHADFLALADDVHNPRNRIVTHSRETVLFDFDLLFCGWEGSHVNSLMRKYAEENGSIPPSAVDVYFEERSEVAKRVMDQEDQFFKFVSLIGDSVDRTTHSIDERIQRAYPFDDATSYFEERLDEFTK